METSTIPIHLDFPIDRDLKSLAATTLKVSSKPEINISDIDASIYTNAAHRHAAFNKLNMAGIAGLIYHGTLCIHCIRF